MRTILGYNDSSAAGPQPVSSVTISLLQSLRYLPLDSNLKERLLNYRILAFNRELEAQHVAVRQWLHAGASRAEGKHMSMPSMPRLSLALQSASLSQDSAEPGSQVASETKSAPSPGAG
jgi:hypothetical protein